MKKILLLSALILISCADEIVEPLVYSRKGKITFSGEPAVDGCGWNIQTNEGETFHPVNLTEGFMKDSLEVGVLLKPLDDSFLCSFTVTIPKVEIVNIEEL